jgi:hypothetical protein
MSTVGLLRTLEDCKALLECLRNSMEVVRGDVLKYVQMYVGP